ncbi:MAG: M48 family metallopeptidase [Bacteroidia bacterium]|nr:M48 family metallopeptidase [Bacteroidia bacterium]
MAGCKFFTGAGLCILFLLQNGQIFSQDFDHYKRLLPSGAIPKDFLLTPSEKYKQELPQLEAESREERKAKVAFYQESFYYMNQLLLSGKVLFNDPVSDYVRDVGDFILKDYPELKTQLRFYVVKSPSVNAFATNNGLILINMGLLAKLENEAQLAFVLCHEISHYIKKHPMDVFLQSKSIEQQAKGIFRRDSLEDIMLAKSNYSKEKELEADIMGLDLYLKSVYDLPSIESAFEVLKNAHLPFADYVFMPDFFETSSLYFPQQYILDTLSEPNYSITRLNEININHPSPDLRKKVIVEKLASIPNEDRKKWVLGEDRFLNIQKICRFESVFLFLYYRYYESAIYHAFFLLKEEPQSVFLQKIIAHSLYGLSKYNNEGRLPEVHKDYDLAEGNIQRLHFFVEKLRPLEMNVLATIYNWKLLQQNPEDQELQLMTDDLMKELGKHHIDSINFIRLAVSDIPTQTGFLQKLSDNLPKAATNLPRDHKLRLKDIHPELEKVVFVDPFYQRIDERRESNIKFIQSETAEQEYIFLLKEYAEKVQLPYEMLSTRQLNADAISEFSDISILNEWVNERVLHDQLRMVSVCHNEIELLTKKYETRYFVWTGVLAFAYARTGRGLVLTAGIFFPPILPYSLYVTFTPDYETNVYTMVYNIESGDYQVLQPKKIKMKDKPDLLHSITYNLVHQLKKP